MANCLPERDALVEVLNSCPKLQNKGGREDIIRDLGNAISDRINDVPDRKTHILNIVRACTEVQNGICELEKRLKFFEGKWKYWPNVEQAAKSLRAKLSEEEAQTKPPDELSASKTNVWTQTTAGGGLTSLALTETTTAQTIAKFLNDHTVLLFIGYALFPEFYQDLSNHLRQVLACTEAQDIQGLPCPTCGEEPTHRPAACPMKKAIMKIDGNPHLIAEQQLAVSIGNLRAFAEHIAASDNRGTLYNRVYEKADAIENYEKTVANGNVDLADSERTLFLHRLSELFLRLTRQRTRDDQHYVILTPNVDTLLERRFSASGIRYKTLIIDPESMRTSSHGRPQEADINIIDPSLSSNADVLIVKLFGHWEKTRRFVLTSEDVISQAKYLKGHLLSPIHTHSCLFLGVSPTNQEFKNLFEAIWKDQKAQTSWLVHTSEPSKAQKAYWARKGVAMIKGCCSDFILSIAQAVS